MFDRTSVTACTTKRFPWSSDGVGFKPETSAPLAQVPRLGRSWSDYGSVAAEAK